MVRPRRNSTTVNYVVDSPVSSTFGSPANTKSELDDPSDRELPEGDDDFMDEDVSGDDVAPAREKGQKSLMKYAKKGVNVNKNPSRGGGNPRPTRTSKRLSESTKKSYQVSDSEDDFSGSEMLTNGSRGKASSWQSKEKGRKPPNRSKAPRRLLNSGSESEGAGMSTTSASENSDPESEKEVVNVQSGRPRRKAAPKDLTERTYVDPSMRSNDQTMFRKLTSGKNSAAELKKKKQVSPLDQFRFGGSNGGSSPRSSSEDNEEEEDEMKDSGNARRPRRKAKQVLLSDDEDDEIEKKDVVGESDENSDMEEYDSEEEEEEEDEGNELYSERVHGEIHRVLAMRKGANGRREFFIKFRDRSYRKSKWLPFDIVNAHKDKLMRAYMARNENLAEGEKPIDEEWLLVDRVIGRKYDRQGGTHFLVKWKHLPYSEASWETEDDLKEDQEAIARFRKYCKIPTRRLRHTAPVSKVPEFQNGRVLRDYQRKSVEWMVNNWDTGINCILGDEMGLGKTAQATAVLEFQRQFRNVRGPFLVIAPLTTLDHWQREIETWTDMYTVIYHGTKDDREVIENFEFEFTSASRSTTKFNVLITAYEVLQRAGPKFKRITWESVIVDEAHRLKGLNSLSRNLVVGLRVKWLLLLTGTPIQNNLSELFSLMNLLNPDRYDDLNHFLETYGGDPPTVAQINDLQAALRPLLLRRMKEDVETLPMKDETLLKCPLTPRQHAYYRALYSNQINFLLGGGTTKNFAALRNLCMELRKVCNHPFLCDGLEEDVVLRHMEANESPPDELTMLIESSGKMFVLNQLLDKLKAEGHKVLIFSQFKIMLNVIEDFLRLKKLGYERIDGDCKQRNRQAAIDRFTRENEENFVFLLSTRAGGAGITLTAADTVIIYDSDWNPQNDLQAMARCHRIGQDREVMIYRMISWDTYEQQLFEVASRKYGLEEALLGKYDADPLSNSKKIFELLKHGAHALANEEEGKAFVAEDIDQILKNRSEKRQIGSRAGNTFSEVTFSVKANENREYWANLLPDAVEKHNAKMPSPIGKRRARGRINYFEGRKAAVESEPESDHGSGQISFHGSSSSDEEGVAGQEKRASVVETKQQKGSEEKWTARDVKALLAGYVAFGCGRSQDIPFKDGCASLKGKSLSNIESASTCVREVIENAAQLEDAHLKLFSNFTEGKAAKTDPEALEKIKDEQVKEMFSAVLIPSFIKTPIMQKSISRIILSRASQFRDNLKDVESVARFIRACEENPESENSKVPYHTSLHSGPMKFKEEHDMAILKGIYKYGYSSWPQNRSLNIIISDPELGIGELIEKFAKSVMKEPVGNSGVDRPSGSKLQTPFEKGMGIARSHLTKRIRNLFKALNSSASNTLANRLNRLNVNSASKNRSGAASTILPKSPSKLLPMLSDEVKGAASKGNVASQKTSLTRRPSAPLFPNFEKNPGGSSKVKEANKEEDPTSFLSTSESEGLDPELNGDTTPRGGNDGQDGGKNKRDAFSLSMEGTLEMGRKKRQADELDEFKTPARGGVDGHPTKRMKAESPLKALMRKHPVSKKGDTRSKSNEGVENKVKGILGCRGGHLVVEKVSKVEREKSAAVAPDSPEEIDMTTSQ
ncbi:hypothetical protein BSKO_09907 [Bryopsis sp. KO-2023]|nr:hypothetical protein BSKO_09907 [Bryopsis sp. KO-2023]